MPCLAVPCTEAVLWVGLCLCLAMLGHQFLVELGMLSFPFLLKLSAVGSQLAQVFGDSKKSKRGWEMRQSIEPGGISEVYTSLWTT